jgi:hypothetical protein
MVDGNPPIMWGFLRRIRIDICYPINQWDVCKDYYGKDNKAYFHGRYVDVMWDGRKWIRRRIKGVCESFPCIRYYYDSRLDVARS